MMWRNDQIYEESSESSHKKQGEGACRVVKNKFNPFDLTTEEDRGPLRQKPSNSSIGTVDCYHMTF